MKIKRDEAGRVAGVGPTGDDTQAGGLGDLANEAEQALAPGDETTEGGQGGALVVPPAPPPPPTNAESLAGIFAAVRESACMVGGIESPRREITDEMCEKLGAIWGSVFDHYGINLHGQMGKYAVVLVACSQSVKMLGPAFHAIGKEIREKDARPKEPKPDGEVVEQPRTEENVIRPTWPQ